MTKENKELLLRDLCARLPYGVKCKVSYNSGAINDVDVTLYGMDKDGFLMFDEIGGDHREFLCKPYLFPLSSMTEEQREEIEDKLIFPNTSDGGWIEILYNNKYEIPFWFVDFCNKNHFDYRGLIPMGLAIDATGKNIY